MIKFSPDSSDLEITSQLYYKLKSVNRIIMAFIFYGTGSHLGASYEVDDYTCPFCNHTNSTDLFIYSNYFHLFFLPFIPTGKTGAAFCSSCQQAISQGRLGPTLLAELAIHEKQYRHSYKMYLGAIIFFGIPAAAVLVAVLMRL
ncbi:MAG: zinc ribbon domain-containing protein [Ferruginibacter sp.]